MRINIRKWMMGAFMLGAMAGLGASVAQAQYPNYPQDRRYPDNRRDDRSYGQGQGTRRDYQADEQRLRMLEDRVRRDKEEIRYAQRRGGRNGFEVRAARERLRNDERELKQLKNDMKRDRKLMRRRGNYRRGY